MKTPEWPPKNNEKRLGVRQELREVLDVAVLAAIERKNKYWNRRLKPTKKNPYPLAPLGLTPEELTPETYWKQTTELKEKIKIAMLKRIREMAQHPNFSEGPCGIELLGAGLLRDLEWLASAIVLKFGPITIRDVSDEACEKALDFTKELPIEVDKVEVEQGWAEPNRIKDESTLMYYAGQFIQVQPPKAKDRIMEHFGRFLRLPTKSGLPRKVYLLHPLGEDEENDPKKNPKAKWRHNPYKTEELRKPLEKGFGGPVEMKIITTHMYFYQKYSLIELSTPAESLPAVDAIAA